VQNAARANGHPTKRVYVTRTRVAAIANRMTERQGVILRDVGRLGVVSGNQLERLHYEPTAAGGRLARKELGRLIRWQVLARLGRSVGGERAGSAGYVYAVGIAGQRLLYPNVRRHRPPWTPQPSYLRHALAVSNLYVGLRECERTDAVALAAYDTEPNCWRPFFGPGGERSTLKPDALAVVHLADYEDHYFIEADCDTEPGPRITAKARAYIRYWQSGREQENHGIFPYVLWMTTTPKRRAFLVDTLAGLPAEHWQIFLVTTAEEAVDGISTGTFMPITNRKEVEP